MRTILRATAWLAGSALALTLPRIVAAQTIAITGARVFPVSGPPIEGGTVLLRDGKIVAVGSNVSVPTDAQRIDAAGKWVTPGIFNATTSLGLTEIGAVDETVDVSARGQGDGFVPSLRVWDGFNAASALLQVTRNDGITTAGLVPRGGLIAGQGAVVVLGDGSLGDVLLKGPAAMFADIASKGNDRGASRAEVYQRLRAVLAEARDWPKRRNRYDANGSRPLAARPVDLEALQPVVRGEIPLAIEADRASDLLVALDIAREFNLKLALTSASEGWKVAEQIAAAKAYVLVGALNNIPRDFAILGARQENAALLQKAGARVVIAGGADAFNARNVKYEAGVAVAFGMPWDAALRAVTLTPAELYGVADRVGSLQPGRDATLVIWSGDPFELYTHAEKVYVRGREVQRPSRQDDLMRRYKTLPPDYRARP
ncbi:MAG: amidohydrolase family protein [Gemmatimonadaceae bacterium]|nr:amidohydrolase family protein [Gemmatimonadaceae bacterium]